MPSPNWRAANKIILLGQMKNPGWLNNNILSGKTEIFPGTISPEFVSMGVNPPFFNPDYS
jgi:hypothetical protein